MPLLRDADGLMGEGKPSDGERDEMGGIETRRSNGRESVNRQVEEGGGSRMR